MLGVNPWGEVPTGTLGISHDPPHLLLPLGSNNSPLPALALENERETFSQPQQQLFHHISVIQPPATPLEMSQIFYTHF